MSADWERFVRGGREADRYVCTLSAYLNAYIKASSREIRIAREYAEKAITKHGLTAEHLPLIRPAILNGEASFDRPRYLTFMYWSVEFQRWFQVTIKCCSERQRLFVTTFHALGADDVIRRRKKYETVWPLK